MNFADFFFKRVSKYQRCQLLNYKTCNLRKAKKEKTTSEFPVCQLYID